MNKTGNKLECCGIEFRSVSQFCDVLRCSKRTYKDILNFYASFEDFAKAMLQINDDSILKNELLERLDAYNKADSKPTKAQINSLCIDALKIYLRLTIPNTANNESLETVKQASAFDLNNQENLKVFNALLSRFKQTLNINNL